MHSADLRVAPVLLLAACSLWMLQLTARPQGGTHGAGADGAFMAALVHCQKVWQPSCTGSGMAAAVPPRVCRTWQLTGRPPATAHAGCRRRGAAGAPAAVGESGVAAPTPAPLIVQPKPGHLHTCTLIYLHGFARNGEDYLCEDTCYPWIPGGDCAPGLRVVLPTGERMAQPWGVVEPSWYAYERPDRNSVGDPVTLFTTRARLASILHDEVARLGGEGRRVFLGGLSQGCTMALDLYVREATNLRLGGFCGSVGFLPTDSHGFGGAAKAMERLIADKEQSARPVWLQCATDDWREVPWRSLVQPSLRRAEGRLPGLLVRTVWGRGHAIEEWEAHILNDFVKQFAGDAYH